MESVTGTAEILGLPQPQVSRSLSKAEQITGLTLRQREGRLVTPTRDAHTLGAAAQQALTIISNTLNVLEGEVRGSIRLAFQHSLGEEIVPHAISSFVAQHPAVGFSLFQGSRAECLHAVESGRADAAFIAVVPDSIGFTATMIQREELALAVPENHRLAAHKTLNPQDLNGEHLVAMKHGLGLRKSVDALIRGWGIATEIAFEGQEISTVLGLVAKGLGVAIVPARSKRDGVTMIPFDDKKATRDLVLVADAERVLSVAAHEFITATKALFAAAEIAQPGGASR